MKNYEETCASEVNVWDGGGTYVLEVIEDEVLMFLGEFESIPEMFKVVEKLWRHDGVTSDIDDYNKILGVTKSEELYGEHGIVTEALYGCKLDSVFYVGVES